MTLTNVFNWVLGVGTGLMLASLLIMALTAGLSGSDFKGRLGRASEKTSAAMMIVGAALLVVSIVISVGWLGGEGE